MSQPNIELQFTDEGAMDAGIHLTRSYGLALLLYSTARTSEKTFDILAALID